MNEHPSRSDADRWRRVRAALQDVLAAPAADQASAIDRACGDDADLRSEVLALVAADREAEGFLEEPADEFAAPYVAAAADTVSGPDGALHDRSGERVGAYRLLRPIGRGGMGAVYLGERADGQFQQQVAIKLLKRGLDSDEIVGRFLRERQILARLQHPHIARLLDGGLTAESLPFFVMEYVEGTPITQHCDDHRLTVPARLALFEDVCRAVDYAHTNLVVHRDLKPTNVLVDASGVVKLLDFGIARLLAGDEDPVTRAIAGPRFLTPEYASPEQLRGEPAVTSSDIYQLGVLLYELLTGQRPYAFSRRDPAEALRVVGSTTPARPSTAVTRRLRPATALVSRRAASGSSEAHGEPGADPPLPASGPDRPDGGPADAPLDDPAALRSTTLASLRKALAGDLDAVTLMALRPDPARRYGSASALADDVQRHLDGRPVVARDEGVRYRAAKFIARHRAAVVAGTAAVLIAIAAIAFYGIRIQAERDRARLEAEKANRSAALLERLVENWNPMAAAHSTLRPEDVLRIAELSAGLDGDVPTGGTMDAALPGGRPRELEASMISLIGGLRAATGDRQRAGEFLAAARAIQEQYLPDTRRDLAATLVREGRVLVSMSRFEESERTLRRALAIYEAELPGSDPRILEGRLELGTALYWWHKFDQAGVEYRRVLEDFERGGRTPQARPIAMMAQNWLGDTLTNLGRTGEAIVALRQALRESHATFGRLHGATFKATASLGSALRDHGELDESERHYRDALELAKSLYGENDVRYNEALRVLLLLFDRMGRFDDEAAALGAQYHRWVLRTNPAGSFQAALVGFGTGVSRLLQDDLAAADAALEEALGWWQKTFTRNQDEADLLNRLAYIRIRRGDRRAEATYREAVAFHRERPADQALFPTDGLDYLAWAMHRHGDVEDAVATYRQALAVYRGKMADGHPYLLRTLVGLGAALMDLGRIADAEPYLNEAAKQWPLHPTIASRHLADVEAALARWRKPGPRGRR